MKHFLLFISLFLLSNSHLSASTSQLWFSDQPPDKQMLKNMRRRHGGFVHIEDGLDIKQLWLRRGTSLDQSTYISSADGKYILQDVQKKITRHQTVAQEGEQSIRFAMPDEGYYSTYFIQNTVQNQILAVSTAKAETLKHNCRNGHKYDSALANPNYWQNAPLDIVRLRVPDEDFHTRIRSGTLVEFQIFHKGTPAVGASVQLETKKGWIKSTQSDAQGIARFEIIQDNFFDAEKAEKEGKKVERGHGGRVRINDSYLVTAQYLTDEAGSLNNQDYTQTEYSVATTGRYHPQQLAKKSAKQALYFASAGMLVMGIGGYRYRKRRVKPFKEEQFNEH